MALRLSNAVDEQKSLFAEPRSERPDTYEVDPPNRRVVRRVRTRSDEIVESCVPLIGEVPQGIADAEALFDFAWLRSKARPPMRADGEPLRVADLFAGCGAMSLGVAEASRALGRPLLVPLALDFNPRAVAVYQTNFPDAKAYVASVEERLDGDIGAPPTESEAELATTLGDVDLLVGGPPCQGHSDLNNRTRRRDPKNSLYGRMGRFAEIVRPTHIVIENVPGVIHDKGRVVQDTHALLHRLGYRVDTGVLRAVDFGVPQRRKRFFTVASLTVQPDIVRWTRALAVEPRSFTWACGDLADVSSDRVYDSASPASSVNQRRIDYLFEHDLYELPDSERPDCHRLRKHSYTSVYGRIRPNEPVPTITSGFGSMGQGRFVHPTRRRTITPHEAARLQFFPDFFDFATTQRHSMQEMIGNAVPPKLAYVIALSLLH
jgi:DNA (cytosine-5)-methyltransferase 1